MGTEGNKRIQLQSIIHAKHRPITGVFQVHTIFYRDDERQQHLHHWHHDLTPITDYQELSLYDKYIRNICFPGFCWLGVKRVCEM